MGQHANTSGGFEKPKSAPGVQILRWRGLLFSETYTDYSNVYI